MSLIARVKSWLRVSSRRDDFEREMQDEMRTHLERYQADLRRLGVLAGPAERVVLEPHFDLRVLGFTAGVSVATALLFSLAPALRATRVDAAKPGAAGGTTTHNHLGRALVVVQVTLSLLLLCGAALFLRTLHNLNRVPAGFDRNGVLTMRVEVTVPGRTVPPKTPAEFRADHARLGAIWTGFIERVREVPGVSSAAVATMNPLSGWFRGVRIAVHGPVQGPEKDRGISINQVTDGYFETTGIRLLAGRSFTPRDRSGSLRVAILNETAARAFFGAETPLGRKVNFPGQRVQDDFEIVGVVADTRYKDLRTPDERMAYLPLEQAIDPITNAIVSVRGPGDVTRLAPAIRAIATETVPGGFATGIATMEQQVEMSLVRERMLALLATFFAALALILACIGLYGVMAYRVARRTREIGIRIAVGARQQSVVWMMVRETLLLVTVGAALGTLASLAANRYIAGQLFGVTPRDPIAIVVALSLLAIVTMVAGYVPARHASRIDPVKAYALSEGFARIRGFRGVWTTDCRTVAQHYGVYEDLAPPAPSASAPYQALSRVSQHRRVNYSAFANPGWSRREGRNG